MADGVTMNIQGIKEIREMFNQMPKEVKQDVIWSAFWRKQTKDLINITKSKIKDAKEDIPYPPAYKRWLTSNSNSGSEYTGPMIKKRTLKESIGFFRTKASKKFLGGYVGPRVKGKFRKEHGGYYGAWVNYGSDVNFFGEYKGKKTRNKNFMQKAWNQGHKGVLRNGLEEAEKIFKRKMKAYEKRMTKFGKLGY